MAFPTESREINIFFFFSKKASGDKGQGPKSLLILGNVLGARLLGSSGFFPLFSSASHPSFALSHDSLELRLLGDN